MPISSIVGGIIGAVSNRKNRKSQERANQLNVQAQKDINQQNIENQRYINQQNIDWAKQNYQQSYADSIKFWQMENEYNSPEMQMARLKDAGLNPHLVYGQGATATGGSIGSPQYDQPNLGTPNLGAPHVNPVQHDSMLGLGNMLQYQLQKAQIDKIKADTESTKVATRGSDFDLRVKEAVGFDEMVKQLDARLLSDTQENRAKALKAETLVEVIMQDQGATLRSDGSLAVNVEKPHRQWKSTFSPTGQDMTSMLVADVFGLPHNKNQYLIQQIKNLEVEFENIGKKGELYDQQKSLNEIKIKVEDFRKTLRGLGVSPESTQALQVIVSLLRAVFN